LAPKTSTPGAFVIVWPVRANDKGGGADGLSQD
jgi:hypothetical protein